MDKALVILYKGDDINKETASAIGVLLSEKCSAKEIECICLLEEEIMSSIVDRAVKKEMTAADHAIVYLGTILKDVHRDPFSVIGRLANEWRKSTENGNIQESKRLVNALHIISQKDVRISKHLMRKYDITKECLSWMRNFCSQGIIH